MKERDDLPTLEVALDATDPRPMTASGLLALQARISAAPGGPERDGLQRLADLAIVPPPPPDTGIVGFGATVTLEDPAGSLATFTIVGEDEIDIEHGKVGAESPLAQALLGKRAGQSAIWKRPVGDRKMRVRSVSYQS
jgi:transcription elongation GreA/GreB family factor